MISYLIIHCSATERGRDFDISDIDRWHRQRGFLCVGYHFFIKLDGTLQKGRAVGREGAHTLHYNKCSIGICYCGGVDGGKNCNTLTAAQNRTLIRLVKGLLKRFPQAKVCGHRDLDPRKDCPCFDVSAWARSVGINSLNIL